MAVCIFCQQDRVLTAEHVFPKWMTNLFPRGTGFTVALADDESEKVIEFGGRKFNYTSRVVCGSCNSGWMSAIEGEACGLLTALIRGEQSELDLDDVILLGRWTTKTAIVSAHAGPRVHPVAWEHGQWLYQQQVPTGHTFLWLGTYGGRAVGPEQWKMLPRALELSLVEPPQTTFLAYSWTATFGKLLLKAVFLPPILWASTVAFSFQHAGSLVQIWPQPPDSVRFPLDHATSEEHLPALDLALGGVWMEVRGGDFRSKALYVGESDEKGNAPA